MAKTSGGVRGSKPLSKELINKRVRKIKDKELSLWNKRNIPAEVGLNIKGKQFFNNEILINRASIKGVYSHFTEPKLKDLVKDIKTIIKKGQFKSEEPLNINSKNYEKKKRSGITSYRYYVTQYRGLNLRVNTVVMQGREKLYSLNIIKKPL